MSRCTKAVLAIAGGAAILVALTYQRTIDHLSCADCRSLRYVTACSILGIQYSESERFENSPDVPAGHVHHWWRYSMHTYTALSTTAACKVHRFADHKNH